MVIDIQQTFSLTNLVCQQSILKHFKQFMELSMPVMLESSTHGLELVTSLTCIISGLPIIQPILLIGEVTSVLTVVINNNIGHVNIFFIAGNNIIMFARGDKEGKPRKQTGWRASCMYLWKNSGPCFLRPTGSTAYDSPDSEHATENCVSKVDTNGKPIISEFGSCKNAWADDNNVIHGAAVGGRMDEVTGPFTEVDDAGNC